MIIIFKLTSIIAFFISFYTYSSVVLTPKRIVIENKDRVAEVLLVNKNSKPQRYRLSIINKVMLDDGNIVDHDQASTPFNTIDKRADEYIIFSPKQVVVPGNSTQKIRIMSRINSNNDDGEYRSHLLVKNIPDPVTLSDFNSNKKSIGMKINAIYGVSIPIIIRKGELTSNVSIDNFNIFEENEHNFIEFTLSRTGNKSTFGKVEITNSNDIVIARVTGVAIYLSTNKRTLRIKIPRKNHYLVRNNDLIVKYTNLDNNNETIFKIN